MKKALHAMLTVTLLMQGAMAVAMPMAQLGSPLQAQATPQTDKAMPCHGDMAVADAEQAPMSCCDSAGHCAAMCAAPAVMASIQLITLEAPDDVAYRASAGEVHKAHRLSLLRPPIASLA